MLLQLAPAGSFAAIADGRIVGTAIGIDYGAFGWIAMMLVDPAWRGRGIGARLLEEAMGAVPPEIPIRLDATPLGRPLYRAIRLRRRGRADASCRRAVEPPCRPGHPTSRRVHVRGSDRGRSAGRERAGRSGLRRPPPHRPRVGARWRAAVRACDRNRRRRTATVSDVPGASSIRLVRWSRPTTRPRERS